MPGKVVKHEYIDQPPAQIMNSPPKYKVAFITWLAIYPLITVILYVFGPWLMEMPLAIRTLVLTAVLVPLMVYVLVPGLRKVLRNWLS